MSRQFVLYDRHAQSSNLEDIQIILIKEKDEGFILLTYLEMNYNTMELRKRRKAEKYVNYVCR